LLFHASSVIPFPYKRHIAECFTGKQIPLLCQVICNKYLVIIALRSSGKLLSYCLINYFYYLGLYMFIAALFIASERKRELLQWFLVSNLKAKFFNIDKLLDR